MFTQVQKALDTVHDGGAIDQNTAVEILESTGAELTAWLAGAHQIREKYRRNAIHLCSIINAKSGRCPENCAFCAQSSHYQTDSPEFALVTQDELIAGAKEAELSGSCCYGIVTSGTRVTVQEFQTILDALGEIRHQCSIVPSASLGLLDRASAEALAKAGCGTYHHNLETARSFFPQICTTHAYDEDVETVRVAKDSGMKVCCGGLFGLGESLEQRIEFGRTLAELEVDSVPINFLNPVDGTPLEGQRYLQPMDCIRIIALMRYLLPKARLSVCGGREVNLHEYQSWIFMAGADGMMTGNYLTTSGRAVEDDHRLLADGELQILRGC